MGTTSRWGWMAGVALLTWGIVGSAPAAPLYSGLYVFGDSLSDTGNVYLATGGYEPAPPYSSGRFTNGNVWIQDLASNLGLGPVTPSLTGGNDFAVGGAQSGPTDANPYTPGNPVQPASDLPAQFQLFKKSVSAPQPDALYTLWIGSNDIDALVTAVLDGSLSSADIGHDIGQAVGNIQTVVDGLAGQGMQNLLALNVPDLSKTPDAVKMANATANPSYVLSEINNLSARFNTALSQMLASAAQTDGFHVNLVDIYSAIDQVVADPAANGLTDVTDPCWTGNFHDVTSGRVCSNPNQHLFWDGLHPTAAGHQLVAETAQGVLSVPEPANGGLFVLGMAGILLLIARRRRQTDAR